MMIRVHVVVHIVEVMTVCNPTLSLNSASDLYSVPVFCAICRIVLYKSVQIP